MESAEPIDLRRRWLAITLATVVMQFAYWPVLATVAARGAGASDDVSGGLLALGLALTPFAFMVLAFASRHPNAAMATLKAMGLFILIGMPLVVIVDGVSGMVAGLSFGGVVALQRDPDVHSSRWRWIAAAAATVYVFAIRLVAVDFALMSGAVLPFAVHGLVDQAAETRET